MESAPIEIVPHVVGKNRYNATFVPDSSFLLYSESIRQTGDSDAAVDAYSDPSAKTWAVTPIAGAQAVSLDRSNAVGVADTLTLVDGRDSSLQQKLAGGQLMNTFARAAPFASQQDGHKLFWFTASSQRRAGVRRYYPTPASSEIRRPRRFCGCSPSTRTTCLPARMASYPGFFLPFQDMTTSNHMATWTQKYVSDQPPPGPRRLPHYRLHHRLLPRRHRNLLPATAATSFRTAADRARRTAATRATTTGAATTAATATAHRSVEGIWGDEYHSARQQRLPLSIGQAIAEGLEDAIRLHARREGTRPCPQGPSTRCRRGGHERETWAVTGGVCDGVRSQRQHGPQLGAGTADARRPGIGASNRH